MSTRAVYKALLTKRDVLCRVIVNDVPVITGEESELEQKNAFLNGWLASGSASIRIQMAWAQGVDPLRSELKLDVREILGIEDATSRTVAAFVWPPPEGDPRAMELALRRRRHEAVIEFVPERVPPAEYWRDARPFELTDAARSEIVEQVVTLQRAFDRTNLRSVANILAYRNKEVAKAFHSSEKELMGEITAFALLGLPDAVLDGEVEPEPKDFHASTFAEGLEEELEVHLVAESRIAWVTREGFEPALRMKGPPMYMMAAFLGRVGGRFTFVR